MSLTLGDCPSSLFRHDSIPNQDGLGVELLIARCLIRQSNKLPHPDFASGDLRHVKVIFHNVDIRHDAGKKVSFGEVYTALEVGILTLSRYSS